MRKCNLTVAVLFVGCLCLAFSSVILAQEPQEIKTTEEPVGNIEEGVAPVAASQQESVSTEPGLPESQTVSVKDVVTEPAAQETVAEVKEPVVGTQSVEPSEEEKPSEPEEEELQWLWGEVVSVNSEKKEFVIKHMDYETFQEVQTTIKIGEKTVLENIPDLAQLRAGDHVTLDYKVKEGSNLAELVVVEKEPAAETVESPESSGEPIPLNQTSGTAQ